VYVRQICSTAIDRLAKFVAQVLHVLANHNRLFAHCEGSEWYDGSDTPGHRSANSTDEAVP